MTTTIDAVLPLTLRDAERADLLFESLTLNFAGLRRLWVIVPDAQLDDIKRRYAAKSYPFELHIESELNIVPEFSMKVRQSGWFRQQMIKLAMHAHVASPLYLTLDADVVCSRPVTAEQLIGNGKGACFTAPGTEFNYWYRRVEQVLRLKAARSDVMHNVTPALLHRDAVAELQAHINNMIKHGKYSQGLRGLKQRWYLWKYRGATNYAPWRVFLVAARPWTEYALYYTFLESTGKLDRYHVHSAHCIYDLDYSLWNAHDGQLPSDWDPAPAFAGTGPPWFLVAQSNTGISAANLYQKLAPLLKQRP